MSLSFEESYLLALKECDRQNKKWGANRGLDNHLWNTILTEETGEVAKEVLERADEKMTEELIQSMAVIMQWLKDKGVVIEVDS